MVVWLAAIVIGSALVAVGLLAYLPLPHDANERVAINAPVPLPADNPESRDESATATRKNPGAADGAAGSQPAPPAAKPDKPLEIVAEQPKEPPPHDRKGMIADEATGLPADAPPKPESVGVPNGPKVNIVDDTSNELYAARAQPKTAEWLAERGGTVELQKAVEDGLNWLARHQGQDGHWSADCLGTVANSRCEQKAPCQGPGMHYEIAHTGLALLAFQAAGHYYFNGQKYSGQVAKGLDYLLQKQAPDGRIATQNPKLLADEKAQEEDAVPAPLKARIPQITQILKKATGGPGWAFMYEHAIATFALCEACAVAIAEGKQPDPRYQEAAQRAVYFIEYVQHDDGGWRYTVDASEKSDCSVSGWVMLALKTARAAKLDVQLDTISRMMNFFAARYADGRTYYIAHAPPPEFSPQPYIYTDAVTGVGMMAVEFFQHKLDSPVVQRGAAYLADKADGPGQPLHAFAASPFKAFALSARPMADSAFFHPSVDYYLWHNGTMAMFQAGGGPWKRFNSVIRDHLVTLQARGEGCDRGSWPPDDVYGDQGGRIYSTALAVLTLEVYYRFQRIAGQPEMEQFFGK